METPRSIAEYNEHYLGPLAVSHAGGYKQTVLRVVYARGRKWTVVLRDFTGLRVLHSFAGVDYVEWPVLRPDGTVVFPSYQWNGERSIKNSESASHPIPSDVVEIVKELLNAGQNQKR